MIDVKYPRRRKSPYKHHVTEHIREGHHVEAYVRGKGAKSNQPKRPFHRALLDKISGFQVNIEYPNYSKETFDVKARGYLGALDEAIDERSMYMEPVRISLRRVKE